VLEVLTVWKPKHVIDAASNSIITLSSMKTRSKKPSAKASEKAATGTSTTVQRLEPSVSNPPHVFILPKDTSSSARILTLPNPATSSPNRYLLCPEKGFYEFTRVAAPKKACRSWLLAADRKNVSANGDVSKQAASNEGYVLQSPDMMLATQIDPIFLLLPALAGDEMADVQGGRREQEYLSPSDYMERLGEISKQFGEVLQSDSRSKLEVLFEARMQPVCDVMDAGDEQLYTLSKQNLLLELVEKARRIVKRGLPASMEERFVKRELAAPVLSVKREESSTSAAEQDDSASGDAESQSASQSTSQDTQSSVTSSASTSTAATSIVSTQGDDSLNVTGDLSHLLRLRTALSFLLNSYIAPKLRGNLESLLKSSPTIVDFSPLDKHLVHINQLKKEAQALRSMSDNISRKRSADEDDDALEKAEAKKRKKEEEEIRKKNMSRGVQQLKKADTSGMKKLSAFFAAKPATKKT
jgi:hypothetical protein